MLKEFTALIHVCSLWFPWQVDQVLHSFRICIPVFEQPGFVEFARHLHMWRDGRIYRMNFCVILIHVVPSRFFFERVPRSNREGATAGLPSVGGVGSSLKEVEL